MKVVDHPYLEGVKCREDGAVWVPVAHAHPARWTFGTAQSKGYRCVRIARKFHRVHQLICEAFHGLCPSDKCQVDHINRVKDDNRPENLRWVTRSENMRNRAVNEESLARYGVSCADDAAAYYRALYARNPEYRERHRKCMHDYYEAHKGARKRAETAV